MTCHLCHQGTCPCAKCGELPHVAADCIVAGMEEWSRLPTTKRSKRYQVTPERNKPCVLNTDQMWCGKCSVPHSPNEPCKYPDVLKSIWCSSCGSRQNDHVKGCPTVTGTTMIKICQKCGEEGHVQEDCALIHVPCYKCGEMGHMAGECSQMGRFALRHQIYDQPSKEKGPFCQQCWEEGHWTKDCQKIIKPSEKKGIPNKYQEAYEDLRHSDPIASIDETATEYPSKEYRQIDQMLEERRNNREQTPRRDLNGMGYQP